VKLIIKNIANQAIIMEKNATKFPIKNVIMLRYQKSIMYLMSIASMLKYRNATKFQNNIVQSLTNKNVTKFPLKSHIRRPTEDVIGLQSHITLMIIIARKLEKYSNEHNIFDEHTYLSIYLLNL